MGSARWHVFRDHVSPFLFFISLLPLENFRQNVAWKRETAAAVAARRRAGGRIPFGWLCVSKKSLCVDFFWSPFSFRRNSWQTNPLSIWDSLWSREERDLRTLMSESQFSSWRRTLDAVLLLDISALKTAARELVGTRKHSTVSPSPKLPTSSPCDRSLESIWTSGPQKTHRNAIF